MTLGALATRKNIIIGSIVLLLVFFVAGFFILRRPARVAMERYIPADALAYIEIDSLTDLVDGLTHTKAWRELAPVLGMSSQIRQVGLVADLIGRSGFGPDEAVVAGRAQYAVAVTGIESNAGQTDEGPFIHLRPHFALIVETHSSKETANRLVRDRSLMIAQKIYGESVAQRSDDYQGAHLLIFNGPGPGHQLIVSNIGTVILIANQVEATKKCLDAIAGRNGSLAEDTTLKTRRLELGKDPAVFAYIPEGGVEKLAELWPLFAAGSSGETANMNSFADLIDHLSKQAGAALLYSLSFDGEGVSEKYLTVLRDQVADALSKSLKANQSSEFASLTMVPKTATSVTVFNVENAGELPERVLKQLSPAVDIVTGVALREFVIAFRKQYGLEPSESAGDAIGNEVAVISFDDEKPRAMLLRVNDRGRASALVDRYLGSKGGSVVTEDHDGMQIKTAAVDENRSAALAGDYVVLGNKEQIVAIIETLERRDAEGDRIKKAFSNRSLSSSILRYKFGVDDAGKLMLALSKLTRVTDGAPELLESDAVRKALGGLPRSVSFTEFRDYGVMTETRSAVGNFGAIGSLID
jgi:hypothetical protein